MKKYSLEFCFKGSRTYVHGTDIFNKLTEQLKSEMLNKEIDLSFHGIAKANMDLISEKPENEELLKFAIKFTNKNNERDVLYAVENGENIECRYEYPEEDICKLSNLNLDGQEVKLECESSYTFVENSVALNKYLLESLFPDANGKWYFTRFQLNKVPENIYPLRLELKANFNFKLTKTEIFVNDESIGFIYFSLV
ncbi:hypothetical protein [Aliarcobacter cryaerophilus]|uniref:hypothetical protein n=1 Tax=Aliarcobacter cryaerophilus TaxID=28198 RepID=UPI00082409B0|nr:hypothetical protein [Aliarcobacter cryaerophilus]